MISIRFQCVQTRVSDDLLYNVEALSSFSIAGRRSIFKREKKHTHTHKTFKQQQQKPSILLSYNHDDEYYKTQYSFGTSTITIPFLCLRLGCACVALVFVLIFLSQQTYFFHLFVIFKKKRIPIPTSFTYLSRVRLLFRSVGQVKKKKNKKIKMDPSCANPLKTEEIRVVSLKKLTIPSHRF